MSMPSLFWNIVHAVVELTSVWFCGSLGFRLFGWPPIRDVHCTPFVQRDIDTNYGNVGAHLYVNVCRFNCISL